MPTLPTAVASMKARIAANFSAAAVRYHNEDTALPDDPAPFIFVEFIAERPFLAGFGGGVGANLQRTGGRIEAHVLVPVGSGIEDGLSYAETFAAVFRGLRVDDISFVGLDGELAQVFPADGATDDGSYSHVATTLVPFYFDQSA